MIAEADSGATGDLTIRGLPTSVRRILAARAEARRISLNALVIEVLTREAQTPVLDEWSAEVDGIRQPTGFSGDDVVEAVRAVREERDSKWA